MIPKQQIPRALGTVWPVHARIRYIDENTGKWFTVGSCADTTNAIKEALAMAREGYPNHTLWVHSDTNGHYIPNKEGRAS